MEETWIEQLRAPFLIDQVEVKPGAVSEANGKVLAIAYADARVYQNRLDEVVGGSHWEVRYRPWGERAVICQLAINDAYREDVGESELDDPNLATSAAMQAFKRACAAFGLGRYLYHLPQIWVEADKKGRGWIIRNPNAVVKEMYQYAGITMDKRSLYLQRINTILSREDEEGLLRIGKSLTERA